MGLQRKPPAIPTDLQARLGEVEDIFGPNRRARGILIFLGIVMTALGVLFIILRVVGVDNDNGRPTHFEGAFIGIGAIVLYIAFWVLPTSWIFVCSRGLIHKRGSKWNNIEWSEADKFEDAETTKGGDRHCRIILKNGTEWRFLSIQVAGYSRLAVTLNRRINGPSHLLGAEGGTI